MSRPLKILIATDAWHPQVSGVVRSLQRLEAELKKLGHEINFVTPNEYFSVPCPTYPEIPLAIGAYPKIRKQIEKENYDAIHISTEGPVGYATRKACLRLRLPFTTAYHTRFPEYVQARFHIPPQWTWQVYRWFHLKSQAVMVATPALKRELENLGLKKIKLWSRGVDTELFNPNTPNAFDGTGPHLLYVGRVAVEKNIEAFLATNTPGTKHVVGTGPQLEELQYKYPDVIFHGFKQGHELAQFYASADCFVFPSKTDTFGLVLLEALAAGTPVAAYPVSGPLDVIGLEGPGCLNDDLKIAIETALLVDPKTCREFALRHTWQKSAQQFLSNLSLIEKTQKQLVG